MCIAPDIPNPPKERRAQKAPTMGAVGMAAERARSMIGPAATILTSPLGASSAAARTGGLLGN